MIKELCKKFDLNECDVYCTYYDGNIPRHIKITRHDNTVLTIKCSTLSLQIDKPDKDSGFILYNYLNFFDKIKLRFFLYKCFKIINKEDNISKQNIKQYSREKFMDSINL